MRTWILSSIALLVVLATFVAVVTTPLEAADTVASTEPQRWLPEACSSVVNAEHDAPMGEASEASGSSVEARWNRLYRLGIDAIQREDLSTAETHFCRALELARSFPATDIRFAETLDELGLVYFMRADYDGAELMQGAAVAEMLLAQGPSQEDLLTTAEKSCRSSLATYMVRLGWILERQGRSEEFTALVQQPHRIFEKGYLPYSSIPERLDGLITQYLLDEAFEAADWLSSLRETLSVQE